MNRAGLALPLFGLVVALAAVWFAWPLEAPRFASPHDPGPRALPLLAAGATAAFAILIGVRDEGASIDKPESRRLDAEAPVRSVALNLFLVVLFVGAISLLGFYLAAGVFGLGFARVSRLPWRGALLCALILPLATYLVFELGLHVRLPRPYWMP